MTSPREALEKAGVTCILISDVDGKVQGFKHHDKADRFEVDLPLNRASAADFDAVLLPGGVINGIRERNWVSSRKPDDLPAFNRECVRKARAAAAAQADDRDAREVRA
jgi:putative intracellular protease/amidase